MFSSSLIRKIAVSTSLAVLALPVYAEDVKPQPKPVEPEGHFNVTTPVNRPANVPEGLEKKREQASIDISEEELLQHPDLLKRALISSVLFSNVEGVKVLLPLYKQLPEKKDELLMKISEAMIARSEGEYEQAIRQYREALQQNGDLQFARIALAQALFENHADKSAEAEFQKIKQLPDAPKQIVNMADNYLKALDERKSWQFNVDANYVRDNNINNATGKRQIKDGKGTWTLPKAESAQGIAYNVGASKNWRLADNYALRTELDGYGKFYWDNHKYDDLTVRAGIGGVYQTARLEASLQPFFERRWYGTEKYSKEKGLRAAAQYWVTPKHKMYVAAEAGDQRHERRKHLDGKNYTASATWLFVPNNRQYWTLGADWARKEAKDRSDAYRRSGARVGWTQQWQKHLTTSMSLGYAVRNYEAADIFQVVRKDKEYSASLAVSHKRLSFKGVTPKLVGVWQKTKSNHPFYGHEKSNVYIQLNKNF